MNRRLFCGVLGLLAFGTLAGRVAASEAVRLEHKFELGELMRYRIYQSTSGETLDVGGTEIFVVEGVLRLRVLKILENGDAEIRAAYERGTCSGVGDTVNISADHVAPVTFQVSRTGVIRNEKTTFLSAGEVTTIGYYKNGGRETLRCNIYKSILPALFRGLPTHAVKVGDTWDNGSAGVQGPSGAVAHSKLTSLDTQANGMPAAAISTKVDFEDNPKIAGTQVDVHITLNAKSSFSVEKGQVIRMDEEFEVMTSAHTSKGQTTTTTVSMQATLLPESEGR